MKYSDLHLSIETGVNTISVTPDSNVNVLKYLPIKDKNNIIKMAIQNAEENGVLNDLLLDMYFRLYTVYMYTDIEFTEGEKNNPIEIYDVLESSGLISSIMNVIPATELAYLVNMKDAMVSADLEYKKSIAGTIQGLLNSFTENVEGANEIIKKFNPEDFQQVLNFAKAANGGRNIN